LWNGTSVADYYAAQACGHYAAAPLAGQDQDHFCRDHPHPQRLAFSQGCRAGVELKTARHAHQFRGVRQGTSTCVDVP
jgi:hypothetical protein